MSKSILSNEKECFVCGALEVHKHHIFYGTANRAVSEREGCWVYLCSYHHNMSDEGVHFNAPFDIMLKKYCQTIWEKGGSRDDFRKKFGRSYL